jgi:hypothetical protein
MDSNAINELVKATGKVRFDHYIAAEDKIEQVLVDNLVVTAGKTFIASRIAGVASAVMGWMEVGTSSTAAVVGDTALIGAIAASRTALTVSGGTAGTPTANAVRYVCTFAAGTGTGAWQEAGIFNASSAGTMLCRTVFATINKAAADSITVTWDLTIS